VSTHRAILHVDLDAFFASVEQLDFPELRGKPVLVGGTSRRGVIAAASYEARAFGCKSAMPTAVAVRLCPHAVLRKPRGDRYGELSHQVFDILHGFSPLVQPVSIDEAFVDLTGSERLLGPAPEVAKRIREMVRARTGLTCSVGVAPNKFLAKLASDLRKPDALVVITEDTIQATLDPLPVGRIWGVGPAAEQSLARFGVRTIADLRALPLETLRARFGDFGEHLHRLARGIDDRPVHADRDAKSISHEQTFFENLTDPDEIRAILTDQSEQVARRLRRHGRYAHTISLKIRYGDFETIARARTLSEPTSATSDITSAARGIFADWARASFQPVRLIGVQASNLTSEPPQEGLFTARETERSRAIDAASDAIAQKFGKRAITRARALTSPQTKANRSPSGPGAGGARPQRPMEDTTPPGQYGPGS
jgi:DNA polymerase-4